MVVNKWYSKMLVEWAKSVQRCTILKSAQISVQDVDKMCTNVHKLYTPSMTNLDTILGN